MDSACCPACLSERTAFAFASKQGDYSREGFHYHGCEVCGSYFLHPLPNQRQILDFYSSGELGRSPNRPQIGWADKHLAPERFAQDHEQYMVPLLRHKRQGRLLDFGCGAGWFTHHASSNGFDALGLDFTQAAVERAREVFQGRFDVGDVDLLETLTDASYDVFAALGIVEHLPHPGQLLDQARRLLADDGVLMVFVPTVDSLQFRLLGKDYYWFMAPYHIHLFSQMGISQLLARHGFRVLDKLEVAHSWYWTKPIADRLGVLKEYAEWRKSDAFRLFDAEIDRLLDGVAESMRAASSMILICGTDARLT